MDWQQIREHYPHQWVVAEAIRAYTEFSQRRVEELVVVDAFQDSQAAWTRYKQLHHEDRNREYYVLHTDREVLNIGVLDTFGRVVSE